MDISAHNPTKNPIPIKIIVEDKTIGGLIQPNGLMVVEPNENNYTEEFVDTKIGSIKINKPSKLKIIFKSSDDQSLWVNRIWVNKT